jgi:penicillin-binding protein 1C
MKRSRKSHLRRRSLIVFAFVCFTAVALGLVYGHLPDYRNAIDEMRTNGSTCVVDRNGRLLRLFPDQRERFNIWREIHTFPDILKRAVIAAEDKRFRYHPGFDPIAMARAVYSNVSSGRTVSGASTITQQVVRLIRPRPRTYGAKIVELLSSMKMEWQLSKDEILELHLNLSPMGGTIRGAALASRMYLGKDVALISAAESATLAALPRSPSRYSPRHAKGRMQLLQEKDRILKRMAGLGYLSSSRLARTLGPTVQFKNRSFPLEAPHLVDIVPASERANATVVKSTVDLDLQHSVEQILESHKNRLHSRGITQAAALVVSVPDREVLAMVGSLKYGKQNLGYNNAVIARRGAGSTLKPFLYALALEQGFNAFSVIPDTFRSYPTPRGDYMPVNSDRRSYGPVNIRSALGNSLNISAVKTVKSLGGNAFYQILDRLGLIDETSLSAEEYGLGIAIGNLEVNLYRLVQAYAALADNGLYRNLTVLREKEKQSGVRVLSHDVAFVITNILSDPSARLLTFGNPGYFDYGFPVALKTGTSSNYRDTWLIAYTSKHVIGIWAGNFNGRPNNGVTGSTACGPILKDVIHHLYGNNGPEPFQRPAGVKEVSVCSMSGNLATPACPHKTSDLLIGKSTASKCDLQHGSEYHYLGSPYAQWLHQREVHQGRSRFRLLNPSAGGALGSPRSMTSGAIGLHQRDSTRSRIDIVTPHESDRFILSPYHRNRVLLRALPKPVVRDVIWFIDGQEVATTPPPYEYFWTPTKGRHTIHAVTPDRQASAITIFVE